MKKFLFPTLNAIGLVIFAWFSWLQHDIYVDPSLADVWAWIVFYGLVAVGFFLALLKKFPWPLYALIALYGIYELITTGPGFFANLQSGHFTMTKSGMSPNHAEVELTREFFGAIIALAATGFLAWQRRRKRV